MLERQVLKRRVKRDFLDLRLAPSTTTQTSSLLLDHAYAAGLPARGYAARGPLKPANQAPRLQQAAPPQQLRPPGPARPGQHQYTRPANQAPAATYRARLQQAPQLGVAQAPSVRLASGGHRPASQLGAWPESLETLEVAASSLRPAPPRPLAGNLSATGSPTTQLRPSAPFNDPSWPLLWYLVSYFRPGYKAHNCFSNLCPALANHFRRHPGRSASRAPDGVCTPAHCLWFIPGLAAPTAVARRAIICAERLDDHATARCDLPGVYLVAPESSRPSISRSAGEMKAQLVVRQPH